jgi:hypothetical protein
LFPGSTCARNTNAANKVISKSHYDDTFERASFGLVTRFILIGCVALLSVGCAMSEAVGDNKGEVAAAGAAGAGGAAQSSSGGAAGASDSHTLDDPSGGPSPSVGGSAGAGGEAGSAAECKDGEKLCETGCVAVTPAVGCGSWGCAPCNTPPANSKPICNGALCDFECLPGFVQQGFACVSAQGSGGSGGSGGTSGSGGASAGGGGTAGTGGGSSSCTVACNPSDPQSQFICFTACAMSGGVGLCAPGLNCCVCG